MKNPVAGDNYSGETLQISSEAYDYLRGCVPWTHVRNRWSVIALLDGIDDIQAFADTVQRAVQDGRLKLNTDLTFHHRITDGPSLLRILRGKR